MDKLSINNLFPPSSNKNNNNNHNEPLNVNSIYNQNMHKKSNKIQFSIDGLLSRKEERKRKMIESYRKIYGILLNKISNVNKINDTTEIIYDVPEAIFGCKDYTSTECLRYVENKLRNVYHMDTLKLSDKSIFISWKYIEENRKKAVAAQKT